MHECLCWGSVFIFMYMFLIKTFSVCCVHVQVCLYGGSICCVPTYGYQCVLCSTHLGVCVCGVYMHRCGYALHDNSVYVVCMHVCGGQYVYVYIYMLSM